MLIQLFCALVPFAFPQTTSSEDLPVLLLTEDDTKITESTRIRIPDGAVIRDANGDGVLHIEGERIRIVFEPGSVLRGAPDSDAPDTLSGCGVRIIGQRGVHIDGLHVRGFKTGLFATRSAGLQITGADVSDNFSERLASTPESCDDGADWLACHANDNGEWRTRYGAGIYVEDSSGIVVRDSRARRTQNGLLLDRVTNSKIYDNDFSFLSGWGLGLWRSSNLTVSYNAFDFCIRGYSHGKYNRGQDSAGVLVFEQCSDNVFAYNSATHGGDGVFGFAGSEALGQHDHLPDDFDATGLGNNRNLFLGNDFSYAAAHGLEMTFSFDNVMLSNRFVGNAICGIWGGYSQSNLITRNHFEANGDAGYGKERGGVNIEHSVNNRIYGNLFLRNHCGVHMWWDEDPGLVSTPWGLANETACVGNEITDNRFDQDLVAIELTACQPVLVAGNQMHDVGRELAAGEGATKATPRTEAKPLPPTVDAYPGKNRPVGARKNLAGRENIIMGEWGPWDHEAPFIQPIERTAAGHFFALHNFPNDVKLELESAGLMLQELPGDPPRVGVSATGEGLFPYEMRVGAESVYGVVQRMSWDVATFAYEADPRTTETEWLVAANAAPTRELSSLDLPFASSGPRQLGFDNVGEDVTNQFGTLATTTIRLPAGRYEIQTLSDDGLRVLVDGKRVIDNWTWHAPFRETAEFEVDSEREVSLRVEHFELDGYAVLQVTLHPQ